MVVRAMGADELHVAGDWRAVFLEGRGVTEVKAKDVYTVACADPPDPARGLTWPSTSRRTWRRSKYGRGRKSGKPAAGLGQDVERGSARVRRIL
jgi:hypothetical protein